MNGAQAGPKWEHRSHGDCAWQLNVQSTLPSLLEQAVVCHAIISGIPERKTCEDQEGEALVRVRVCVRIAPERFPLLLKKVSRSLSELLWRLWVQMAAEPTVVPGRADREAARPGLSSGIFLVKHLRIHLRNSVLLLETLTFLWLAPWGFFRNHNLFISKGPYKTGRFGRSLGSATEALAWLLTYTKRGRKLRPQVKSNPHPGSMQRSESQLQTAVWTDSSVDRPRRGE